MAINNTSLYPPTIEEKKTSIFEVQKKIDSGNQLRYSGRYSFNISLSKFNTIEDFNVIQISVEKQKSGVSIIKKEDSNPNIEVRTIGEPIRYRKTGTILIQEVNNIQSSYEIRETDLINDTWEIGEIYKIQIRVGKVNESLSQYKDLQTEWLNKNISNFTEWSTVHIIKAIGEVVITIPEFYFDSSKPIDVNSQGKEIQYKNNMINFYGNYSMSSGNLLQENLYSYRVKLFEYNLNQELILLEDSNIIYANNYYNLNRFNYIFKTQLIEDSKYLLEFTYFTEHNYSKTYTINFVCVYAPTVGLIKEGDFYLYSPEARLRNPSLFDDEKDGLLKNIVDKDNAFSVIADNEEGRISLKLYKKNDKEIYNGNIVIKRTDSKSNFTQWEDIKIMNFIQETFNNKEIIYDYTIESGIFYKYGIQEFITTLDKEGKEVTKRTEIIIHSENIIRDFENSFLLGEDGLQLKLKFNNDMSNFKINIDEGKTNTIGGQYPFISRNGNTYYKSFPINGLISFNMDERHLFGEEYDIYNIKNNVIGQENKKNIQELYTGKNGYNKDKNPWDYYYLYEIFFREKVLKFLHDGKPKLFKSPTEGNILVRLMDINTSPHQNLGRKIYSFSSTAYEVEEATMENYLKYHFYDVGKMITDFSVREMRIGQLTGKFNFAHVDNAKNNIVDNIIDFIWQKYDFSKKDIAGFEIIVTEVQDIEIEFNSAPYYVDNTNNFIGYHMEYNGKQIYVSANKSYYKFDEVIRFKNNDIQKDFLKFIGPDETNNLYEEGWGKNHPIDVTINFLYQITKKPVETDNLYEIDKLIKIGQYYENTMPGSSIFNRIKRKYEYDWSGFGYVKMLAIQSINIEANPGATFYIIDSNDSEGTIEQHIVGETGNLTIDDDSLTIDKDIIFKGYIDLSLDKTDKNWNTIQPMDMDILIDYCYAIGKGSYLNNESYE